MLVTETGLSPDALGELPERLLDEIIIYRGVKNVAQFGGEWQP